MGENNNSNKRILIERTNTIMFVMIGIAAAVLSFTVVSGISFGRRLSYQSKVINARNIAQKQIKDNYGALQKLIAEYEKFDQAPESVIGTKDNNSKVVLDALPSKYDYPAIASSIEKLIALTGNIGDHTITGSDLEAVAEQSSINPKPIEIPITITGNNASYETIEKLINNIQLSIRPFKINKISISGEQSKMTFSISMVTYYMPAKNLEIPLEEVK